MQPSTYAHKMRMYICTHVYTYIHMCVPIYSLHSCVNLTSTCRNTVQGLTLQRPAHELLSILILTATYVSRDHETYPKDRTPVRVPKTTPRYIRNLDPQKVLVGDLNLRAPSEPQTKNTRETWSKLLIYHLVAPLKGPNIIPIYSPYQGF